MRERFSEAHGLCSCPLIWDTNDRRQHQLLLGSLSKLLFFWQLQLNDFTTVLVFWVLHLFSVKGSLKINVISSPQAVAEFRRFVDHYFQLMVEETITAFWLPKTLLRLRYWYRIYQ